MSDPNKDMQRAFERDCRRAAISKAFKLAAAIAVLAAIAYTLAG